MFGVEFNLKNNEKILEIKSPKKLVKGPYAVVYNPYAEGHKDQRWVIVAFDWYNEPRLGIRWFWEKNGFPNSRGIPTWFVIPPMLVESILNDLHLDAHFRDNLNQFLEGKISGEQLKKKIFAFITLKKMLPLHF